MPNAVFKEKKIEFDLLKMVNKEEEKKEKDKFFRIKKSSFPYGSILCAYVLIHRCQRRIGSWHLRGKLKKCRVADTVSQVKKNS